MKKTIAPSKAPSPPKNKTKEVTTKSNGAIFVVMALDMTWRLALSFLIPVLGGDYLDHHFKNPIYLLIGLILGVILAIVVIYFSYKNANNINLNSTKEKKNV